MSRDFFLIESIEREPNYILGHVLVFSTIVPIYITYV